jgi:hypothetical protein
VPNSSFYPLSGCEAQAVERQTAYAASVVHLFKSSLLPTPSTLKADYTTNEANYDAYTAITIAAWDGSVLPPGSGFEILSPLVLFSVGPTDPVVTNDIGGFWLEDAGGIVRLVGKFDPILPMHLAFQAIPLNLLDLFPTGFTG